MPTNRKRRKRVLLVLGSASLLVVLGGAAYLVRQEQLDRRALASRAEGVQRIEERDWGAALDRVGLYMQRAQQRGTTSADDWFLYARAWRHVPVPNNKHLVTSMGCLRKALELEPARRDIQDELLSIYVDVRYTAEALELLDRMLAAAPGEVELLRKKCDLLESQRRFAEALESAKALNARADGSFADLFRTLRLLLRAERPAAEVDAWVEGVVAGHPGDDRFELLRAALLTRRQLTERARTSLDRAVAAVRAGEDAEFVKLLAGELDAAERFRDSLEVLVRAGGLVDEPIRRELVRRLWYAGRADEIQEHVARWKVPAEELPAEVAALLALAHEMRGDKELSAPLRAELARRDDAEAAAWSAFVALRSSNAPVTAADATALSRAAAALPGSAILRDALGNAFAALGETDLALEAWTDAAALAPPWAEPLRRMADVLVATGREHVAPAMARAAVLRAPDDLATIATYLRATANVAESFDKTQIETLLRALRSLRSQSPEVADDTLPVYVGLLARVDRAAAEHAITSALDATTPASEATLLHLAQIAQEAGVKVESRLFEISERAHGVTPRLAYARAVARSHEGTSESAIREFERLRAAAGPGGKDLEWDLAHANLLDTAGRREAGEIWKSLAERWPDTLAVQLGVLASSSAWDDRAAVDRAIERVRALSGEGSVTWRVARARWLLTGPASSDADAAEAARVLNDVVREAPRSASARVLLSQALQRLRNMAGAEEQLRAAAEMAPGDAWIALESARLAQSLGRADDARRVLDGLIASGGLVPEQIERAAYLLALRGDRRRGAELLEPLAARSEARRDGVLLLAQLYSRLGRTERALELVEPVLATPDAQSVELAAELYDALGRREAAEAALALLDAMELPEGEKDLVLGRNAAARGDAAAAKDHFRRATQAGPRRAETWTTRAAHAVRAGDAEDLAAVIADERAGVSEAVRFLRTLEPAAAEAVRDARQRALVAASLEDAAHRPAFAEALRTLARGWPEHAKRDAVARDVEALARSKPHALALQLVAADLAAQTGRLRDACDTALRACEAFPSSAAAAQQATELLGEAGRYEEALEAAISWRDRAGGRDETADVAVAECLLWLGRASEAATTLAARAEPASAAPERSTALLLAYAVSLVRCERDADAVRLLERLTARAPAFRALALEVDPRRLGDREHCGRWLEACARLVPSGDDEAALRLARAWGAAWEAWGGDEFLDAARSQLGRLTARSDAPADAFFVSGALAQQTGDLEAARKGYEAALERDAGRMDARNNLAMVLADTGRWREAVEQATRATRDAPTSAPLFDTLAYALRKGQDFAAAKNSLAQAIRLQPANPIWQLSLAETLAEAGDAEELRRVVARVEAMTSGGASLPPALRERLERLRPRR